MIKLIDSFYDKETFTSYVKIDTDVGYFEGYAFLHPEDEKYESRFIGCEIAEIRATASYCAKKLKILNYELNVLKMVRNNIKNDTNSETFKKLNAYIKMKETEKKKYTSLIHERNERIENLFNKTKEVKDKLEEKKQEQE